MRHFLDQFDGAYLLYDVTPERGTFARFIRGLADVLGTVVPGARLSFASAYERAVQSRNPAHVLSSWMYEHVKTQRLTFAIDNLHHADDDPLTQAFLARLIDLTSEAIRWIVVTRATDYLPLANWMAFKRADLPVQQFDLAFSAAEVGELADDAGERLDEAACHRIATLTDGWASGVAFLCRPDRTAQHAATAIRTFDVILARIGDDLDAPTHDVLLRTCLLPDLAPSLVDGVGIDGASDAVARLSARAPWLFVRTETALRYRDVLAAQLRTQLAQDPATRNDAVQRAVEALRAAGRDVDALVMLLQAAEPGSMVPILRDVGIELFEQGHADLVESCLTMLERADADLPAAILALRAIVESRLGRHDTAEAWFGQALSRAADDDVRVIEISYLYACDLLRRERLDCVDLLEEHAGNATLRPELRALILSALAQARMLRDERDLANRAISSALQLSSVITDEGVVARTLARAAYVALYQDDVVTAETRARDAAMLAERRSMFVVAAGAYSVLYAIASDREQPAIALEHLEHLLENGLKSGDLQLQFYYLVCAFEIAIERGDLDAIDRIDEALRVFDFQHGAAASGEAFLPSEALRASWRGDFSHAYNLLRPSAVQQVGADRTALRWAEVAVYAAAANRDADAEAALRSYHAALDENRDENNRSKRARLLAALALCFTGGAERAEDLVPVRDDELRLPMRLAALRAAVLALHDYYAGSEDRGLLANALDVLRAREFGGLAALIEALPSRAARAAQRAIPA